MELSTVFENLKPDIVVTVADRFETISTAIAASYMNIPLAHIQGGEVTGNIDEKVRHAITKLSDYHFVATAKAKERVIKMGENPSYVFKTGCPSIDIAKEVSKKPKFDFDPFVKYGGVGAKININEDYLVVMQHPVTTEYKLSMEQIKKTIEAINILKIPTFWFWPNVDAGSDGTSKGIRAFREKYNPKHIHFFKNMEPNDFLRLLINSKCLIGNSSVGIRECAYLGVPVVNIGTRQSNRERGKNVVDVDYSTEEIIQAINKLLNQKKINKSMIYGNGNAGIKIADILSNVELIYHKSLSY
jgi:UDP-hydrolysing UDP-N-acetyl-D-glucosamine 2-epimerase